MENNVKKKWIKALPSIGMLIVIALLAGLSFLPCFRSSKVAVSASTTDIDAEAMRVLGCCTAYACANDFDTELNGRVKARVFGVPYTQAVRGGRSVRGEQFDDITESVSIFVKAGLKKSCHNGEYRVVKGTYKNGAFVYGDGAAQNLSSYTISYGNPPTGLVKYELENCITSATAVDEHTFKYVLDVERATVHYRDEIRSALKLGAYPEFQSIEFTLYTDGTRAVKITCVEQFRIEKFGGTYCSAEFTEQFKYVN